MNTHLVYKQRFLYKKESFGFDHLGIILRTISTLGLKKVNEKMIFLDDIPS